MGAVPPEPLPHTLQMSSPSTSAPLPLKSSFASDSILGNRSKGKIKLTPPAYSHTTVLLVSSLNFSLPTQGWLWQGWIHSDLKGLNAVSGTGKCLGWLYPVLLLVLAVQMSTV